MTTVDVMEPHRTTLNDLSPLLGSREVAELLGMSREQVWRLWTSGRLPGYRFDRHVRYSPADVEAFMALHYRGVNGAAGAEPEDAHGAAEYRRI